MKYNHKNLIILALIAFHLHGPVCQASAPFRQNDEEPVRFPGVSMRSGLGNVSDDADQQQRCAHLALLKTAAEEAQTKRAVGQYVTAFMHHFVVPAFLREALPEDVSTHLLQVDMGSVKMNLSRSLEDIQRLSALVLVANGLGFDPLEASYRPDSQLVALVNESFLEAQGDPKGFAQGLVSLAFHLESGARFALTHADVNQMKGALYNRAAEEVVKLIPVVEGGAMREDLYLSAGQLKLWAAYCQENAHQKLSKSVDALSLFAQAASEGSGRLMAKRQSEQEKAYDLMGESLMALGANSKGVARFIEARRQAML